MRCVSCGSTNLIEGTVPQTPKDDLKFHPGGRSFKDRMLGGGRKIRAYGCLHCNHLQFAVDFEPVDWEHYQEFEGTQPPVMERLEGDDEQKGDE
jgi:hypothetical protein